jgi:hypothetical protein
MPDFTLRTYQTLLQSLLKNGFSFQPFSDYIENPLERVVILRHDVDALPGNSLQTAQLEHELGIRGTYYFRIVRQSNRPGIIRRIAELGHEIGYHYEDLSLYKGNIDLAFKSFEKNLAYFRQFAPVKTICMHGSPLSRYDNRRLWDTYNYRDFGITGEPYFDTDFSKVLYLTDTGRCWNSEKFSIRDKVPPSPPLPISHSTPQIKSTSHIITAARNNRLPPQIMITIHPQRWTNNPLPWTKELVWQNLKNVIKRFLTTS